MRQISLIPFVCGAGASTAGAEYGALYCFDHGLAETLYAEGIQAGWAADPHQYWDGPHGEAAHASLPAHGSAERKNIVQWHVRELARAVAAEIGRD